MSKDIYDQARYHFMERGVLYEYGRPDGITTLKNGNRTDSSRTEQDLDHDGRRGVDCSSFVWRGLKNAGYDVGNTPFSTHALYEGSRITEYSKKHFDVIPAAQAQKEPGDLQPGDILMMKSKHNSNQHVVIFKGYDKDGKIEFIGSQTSTGPDEVTMKDSSYFKRNMEIVGALRAKPEFRTHEPVAIPGHGDVQQARAPHVADHAGDHRQGTPSAGQAPETLRKGDRNDQVSAVQRDLNRLGYTDELGRPLIADGSFGNHTRAAVQAFQQAHGLEADGIVGKQTQAAIDMAQKRAATDRLDHPSHPDNPMYQQALGHVHTVDAQHGRTPDQQSAQLAGSLTAAARAEGMTRIDHVALSEDGSRAWAVQGELNSPLKQMAEVQTQQAVNTSLEQSSRAAQAAGQQQHTAAQQQAQQVQAAPAPQGP